MDIKVLAMESFGHREKTYFFDLMRSVNGSLYLKIARSDKLRDESYYKQEVVVFEENFEFFREAMHDLFATAGYQLLAKEPLIKQVGTGGIKNWEEEKRPREKFLAGGPMAVSDAELLAILISSGSLRESAVSLAARILANAEYSLARLGRMGVAELCAFHGMGHAKSLAIMAAMELARRFQEEQLLLGSRQ
jgi:hypothetical protein